MWANQWQGGGNWPMQANFQSMPHDQVDWAALAKQWIAQREALGPEATPGAPVGSVVPPPPPPEEDNQVQVPEGGATQNDMEICEEENAENNQGFQNDQWNWGGMPQQQWNESSPGWGIHPPPQGIPNKAPQGFEYNHGSFQQFDYNHGGEQFGYHDQMENEGPPWGRGPPPHEQYGGPPRRPFRGRRPPRPLMEEEEDTTFLDAAKRKALPAWIREGLEKMEREKQKKLEKEQKARQEEEDRKAKELAEKEAAEELEKEKSGEPRVPRKSRFDSEDEGDRSRSVSPARRSESRSLSPSPRKPSPKRSPSPDEFKTEEEKQMELMLKVRRMLTEILLAVTDTELENIAKEVYRKAKQTASKGSTWNKQFHSYGHSYMHPKFNAVINSRGPVLLNSVLLFSRSFLLIRYLPKAEEYRLVNFSSKILFLNFFFFLSSSSFYFLLSLIIIIIIIINIVVVI